MKDDTQNVYTLIEYLKKSRFGPFTVGDIYANHIDIRSNGMNMLDLNMWSNNIQEYKHLAEDIVNRLNSVPLLIEEVERLNQALKEIYEFYKVDEWEWEGDL